MKATFKGSMDARASETTLLITILFIAFLIAEFSFLHLGGITGSILLSVILIIIYLRAFFSRPVSYEITNDAVIIHRLAKDITIPRNALNKVEIVNKEKIRGACHALEISGLFGYVGKFKNENIGNFTLYATRRNKTVLIQTTDNKKVILTPDKPARFIKHLQN